LLIVTYSADMTAYIKGITELLDEARYRGVIV
jgi:hypothetical protein